MAVEMFCTDSYDASVDLWSVGVILYEALFGYAPFASKSYSDLELKILSKDPIEIPSCPPIYPQCHDLLKKLLQRNPSDRITFEDFFNHPFVDLEHAPTPQCLETAIGLVTVAVKADTEGDHRNALKHYCSALEYFLPAIDYERDNSRKEAIRVEVKQYVDRAEQLEITSKSLKLPPRPSSAPVRQDSQLGFPEFPELNDGFKHRQLADKLDSERKFGLALEEYEKAVEVYLVVLPKIPKGKVRDKVYRETERLMARAEELSRYREILCPDETKENSNESKLNCVIQ